LGVERLLFKEKIGILLHFVDTLKPQLEKSKLSPEKISKYLKVIASLSEQITIFE